MSTRFSTGVDTVVFYDKGTCLAFVVVYLGVGRPPNRVALLFIKSEGTILTVEH